MRSSMQNSIRQPEAQTADKRPPGAADVADILCTGYAQAVCRHILCADGSMALTDGYRASENTQYVNGHAKREEKRR